jgi:site-specific recombinase XerD
VNDRRGTLAKNRPELALLRGKRTPDTLALWVEAFGEGDRELASKYALAAERFLGGSSPGEKKSSPGWTSYLGKLSPATQRAYAFAVQEFFEWLAHARVHGRVVPPHRVLRVDAENYANWLANRPFSLEVEKLRDGDQTFRYQLYQVIEKLGGRATLRDVVEVLPAVPERDLAAHRLAVAAQLGRMVLHDELTRTPTLEELRKQAPRLGIDQWLLELPPVHEGGVPRQIALEDVFTYALPVPHGVSRSTIALRLSALASFWDTLAQGENIAGGEPIVKYNIFKDVRLRVTRGSAPERKAARESKRMDPALGPRLLAAAAAARTLPELRDKALLHFLMFTGTRVTEAIQLRRGEPPPAERLRWPGWLSDDGSRVTLVRKGGKRVELPYPQIALRSLAEFQAELRTRAAPESAQSEDANRAGYLHPDSAKWRYRELAFLPDAPLFPPVHLWGANSTYSYKEFKPNLPNTRGGISYKKGLTRHGVTQLLRRLAERGGLSDAEVKQVHPHALRHWAATAMNEGGKDVREVQAILGHESLTTTETYLAKIEDPSRLSGQAAIVQYLDRFPTQPTGPLAAQPAREWSEVRGVAQPTQVRAVRKPVVPTVGIETTERAPAPASEAKPGEHGPPWEAPARPPTPEDQLAALQAAEAAYVVDEEVFGPEAPITHALPQDPDASDVPQPPLIVSDTGKELLTRDSENHLIAVDGRALPPGEEREALDETEMRAGQSPGSPLLRGHERIEFTSLKDQRPGDRGIVIQVNTKGDKKRGTWKETPMVQTDSPTHEFLAKHYDPWPVNYGIGTSTLLPWYARGAAANDGTVTCQDSITGKTVKVPPIPVLSPAQVYPDTQQSVVITELETLYSNWVSGNAEAGIAPSPTRVYGLVRWFATFAYLTAKLERYLRDKKKEDARSNLPTWVPWSHLATVGSNLREHPNEWTVAWFAKNAHTYTTTRKAFEGVSRARGESKLDADEFSKAFQVAAAEGVTFVEELPAWMADLDPVRAIYDADPKEWDLFARWLASVTGQALSTVRLDRRQLAKALADMSLEQKRENATVLLRQFYGCIDRIEMIPKMIRGAATEEMFRASTEELRGFAKDELRPQLKWEHKERDELVLSLAEMGIPEPTGRGEDDEFLRDKRIVQIVERHIPAEPGMASPNLLHGSRLFDPRYFKIDTKSHTITITEEVRADFAERFDGRDPLPILRRAARGLWEHAKTHGLTQKQPDRSSYSLMYSLQLQYISWILPSPDEMERQAIASGTKVGGATARSTWIKDHGRLMRDILYGTHSALQEENPEMTEADEKTFVAEALGITEEQVDVGLRSRDLAATQHEAEHMWVVGDAAVAAELGRSTGMLTARLTPAEAQARRQQERTEREATRGELRVTREELTPAEAEEYRRQQQIAREASRGVVRRVRVHKENVTLPHGLTPNGPPRCRIEYLEGEQAPTEWYAHTLRPQTQLSANPLSGQQRLVLCSPGVMREKMRLLANASAALPSPFRMIAAMLSG